MIEEAAAGVRFPVDGMTCASCVNRIERYLRKVDGVVEANVNLATESASVRFDPARADLDTLRSAVEAAGYEARVDRAEISGGTNEAEISFGVPQGGPAGPGLLAIDVASQIVAPAAVGAPGLGYQQRHLAETRRRLIVAVIF